MGVPFIDTGIDVDFEKTGELRGIVRCTVGTPQHHEHIEQVVSFAKVAEDETYKNIQVADLNMMSACMAVTKWKKRRGFYADDMREYNSLNIFATHALTKEDRN